MKATLIISEEYKYNQPSVFIIADGQYYGCLIYPRLRNFPQDDKYWFTATCADSDRFFTVKSVEYSENTFEMIKNLQCKIKDAEQYLKEDNANPWIPSPDASKNSKEYKEYVAKKEAQEKAQREIWEHNRPFEKRIDDDRIELRKILLSVLTDEN